MLHVVCDVDGVLADCSYGFTKLGKQLFGGRVLSAGQQESWNFNQWPQWQQDEIWNTIGNSDFFWEELPELTSFGDREAFKSLACDPAINLVYLTSRFGKDVKGQTERWLKSHGFPDAPVELSSNKAEWIRAYFGWQPIVAIDDAPGNIISFSNADIVHVIRDWPYNRHVAGRRVSSLSEFCDFALYKGLLEEAA